MQCYLCETTRDVRGALMRSESHAVGVCHACGAGVCLGHARKAATPGAPLHCAACAQEIVSSGVELAAHRSLVGV